MDAFIECGELGMEAIPPGDERTSYEDDENAGECARVGRLEFGNDDEDAV